MQEEHVHLEPVTVRGFPGILDGVIAGEGASPCLILANLPQTEQFWLFCSRSNSYGLLGQVLGGFMILTSFHKEL